MLPDLQRIFVITRPLDTQMLSEASIQKCFQVFLGEDEDRSYFLVQRQ